MPTAQPTMPTAQPTIPTAQPTTRTRRVCRGRRTKSDFEDMKLDWADVCKTYFASIQPNGLVKPALYTNETGTYDLGVAMAAASCIHPSHKEFGVT